MVTKTDLEHKKARADLSIDRLLNLYEISNQAEGKSQKTVQWYKEMLSLFHGYCINELGHQDLSRISIDTARKYVLHLRGKHKFEGHPYIPEQAELLSARTIQCHVRVLKAFFSWLDMEGYTDENVLKNLKLPKAPAKILEPLTTAEIHIVINSINMHSTNSIRNRAMIIILLDTGLRASELTTIDLNRLNLKEGFITVMGKGAKERVVPIGKYTVSILLNYFNYVRQKTASPECDRLFLSPSGKPILTNTVKLLFSRLAKISGVNRLHAHLCRHTFAINYLLNGGDIFSLREILGHTTFEMVDHYLHFTSSQITAQHHKYSPMDKLQPELEATSS